MHYLTVLDDHEDMAVIKLQKCPKPELHKHKNHVRRFLYPISKCQGCGEKIGVYEEDIYQLLEFFSRIIPDEKLSIREKLIKSLGGEIARK